MSMLASFDENHCQIINQQGHSINIKKLLLTPNYLLFLY